MTGVWIIPLTRAREPPIIYFGVNTCHRGGREKGAILSEIDPEPRRRGVAACVQQLDEQIPPSRMRLAR